MLYGSENLRPSLKKSVISALAFLFIGMSIFSYVMFNVVIPYRESQEEKHITVNTETAETITIEGKEYYIIDKDGEAK